MRCLYYQFTSASVQALPVQTQDTVIETFQCHGGTSNINAYLDEINESYATLTGTSGFKPQVLATIGVGGQLTDHIGELGIKIPAGTSIYLVVGGVLNVAIYWRFSAEGRLT